MFEFDQMCVIYQCSTHNRAQVVDNQVTAAVGPREIPQPHRNWINAGGCPVGSVVEVEGSVNLAGRKPSSGLEIAKLADMLDLRGLARPVDNEAGLGGLKVVDDVLGERFEIVKGGSIAECFTDVVGDDLDDLGDEGALVDQQGRILEDSLNDVLGGLHGDGLGLGDPILEQDLGDLGLNLVTLLGIALEAVEVDMDRELRLVDARLSGGNGSRSGIGSVGRGGNEGSTSCESGNCTSGDETILDHEMSSLVVLGTWWGARAGCVQLT